MVVLGLSALSSQALAADAGSQIMKSVNFNQQEISTTEGVISIHKRVISAAKDICVGNDIRSRLGISQKLVDECVIEITESALSPEKYSVLSSYHTSLSNPASVRKNRLTSSNWTIEKYKMAEQSSGSDFNALP